MYRQTSGPKPRSFLRYIGLFIVVQSAYISFISFFRGYSLLKITMITSVVMNLINIAGNCILIHGLGPIPSLGVFGRNHIHQHQQDTGAAFNFILFPQIY